MLPLKIRQEIINHLESGDKDSGLPLAQNLAKLFPQYIYRGLAFRSLLSLDPIGEIKVHAGDSFSSSSDSIEKFFSDQGYHTHEQINAVVVEAEITGFNLSMFLQKESHQFPAVDVEDISVYLSENEVICLDSGVVLKQYDYNPKLGK